MIGRIEEFIDEQTMQIHSLEDGKTYRVTGSKEQVEVFFEASKEDVIVVEFHPQTLRVENIGEL